MVGNISGECPFESVLTIWCSSLLEDARGIPSVQNLHLAVSTRLETLCFAFLYMTLKIVNFMFLHFLSAWRLSLLAMKSSSLIDSNHGEELWVISFCREGGGCLSSTVRKKSQNGLPFQQLKTQKSSAKNDGRSMLAMFLTVLHRVEGLETGTLK